MTVEFTLDRAEFVAFTSKAFGAVQLPKGFVLDPRDPWMRSIISGETFADGGSTGAFGWLKDKFDLSGRSTRLFSAICWPIRSGKVDRVMKAMMEMDSRYRRLERPRKDEG
jgi:predicted 3-demethylubiquinone-9 3-methyltransferase (glyoxalase superfamily)